MRRLPPPPLHICLLLPSVAVFLGGPSPEPLLSFLGSYEVEVSLEREPGGSEGLLQEKKAHTKAFERIKAKEVRIPGQTDISSF